jgi:excinuclease ABC subunit C
MSQIEKLKEKVKKFPTNPGVYFFMGPKKEILYVGKATNLRERVKSYFSSDLLETRGPILVAMLDKSVSVEFEETDSVLEAVILEAHYIKKHQPRHNSKDKDNKSFTYVAITKEDFPRVLLVRGRELFEKGVKSEYKKADVFGPFPQSSVLKEALKLIRKIFPFRDKCTPSSLKKDSRPCFNEQIGLCPGVCTGEVLSKEYLKNVKHIKLFFEGKKKRIISSLEKEMMRLAKKHEFEKAAVVRGQINSLLHLRDVSLIKSDFYENTTNEVRIEGYDVAHTSGKDVVGVLVVSFGGEVQRDQFRKFILHEQVNNDTKNIAEIVERRFAHPEWGNPNLLVIDGGKGQVNAVLKVLARLGIVIPVVGVVKDEHHRAREIIGDKKSIAKFEKQILNINNEAHKSAINFHKKRRGKALFGKK